MEDVDKLALEDAPKPKVEMIEQITDLAKLARLQEGHVAQLNLELQEAKRRLDQTLTRTLPELMDKAGIPSITIATTGGQLFTVSVKTMYSASIGAKWEAERKKAAYNWLDGNGHGSLIKTEVVTNFPRDERDEVSQFVKYLDESGQTYTVRESVHSATLTAWLKEMCESGNPPPLDTIGGYVERQAEIKDVKS